MRATEGLGAVTSGRTGLQKRIDRGALEVKYHSKMGISMVIISKRVKIHCL